MRNPIMTPLFLCAWMSVAQAQFGPPPLSPLGQVIQRAVDSDIRTPEEKARDANRKPRETLEFLRLKEDLHVVELVPSGGWYTKIIAPVVAGKGKYSVALGTRSMGALIEQYPDELSQIEILQDDAKFKPTDTIGLFDLDKFSLGASNVDLVLTFRNLHNFLPAARNHIHQAVFEGAETGRLLRCRRSHASVITSRVRPKTGAGWIRCRSSWKFRQPVLSSRISATCIIAPTMSCAMRSDVKP